MPMKVYILCYEPKETDISDGRKPGVGGNVGIETIATKQESKINKRHKLNKQVKQVKESLSTFVAGAGKKRSPMNTLTLKTWDDNEETVIKTGAKKKKK